MFTSCSALTQSLNTARATNAYERKLQALSRIHVLIIDDFGLKPLRAPADEDLHELIAERYERAATGFHADQALLPVGKVFEELLALELQAHDFSALHVDPVQLKHPLGDIDADYCFATIHFGPSGLPVKIFVSSTLGTLMPSAREGPPFNPPPPQSYPRRRAPQVHLYRR